MEERYFTENASERRTGWEKTKGARTGVKNTGGDKSLAVRLG